MFGCDGDANPGYALRCWACHGETPRECRVCGGTGQLEMLDCPVRVLTPEVAAAHEAFLHYRAGFLPVAGGMMDQAHAFCKSAVLLSGLYAMHERIEMEKSRGGRNG